MGAVPPSMLKTAANPKGLPLQAFDELRSKTLADRSQFFQDLSGPFFGANRPGVSVLQGPARFVLVCTGMQAGLNARVRLHQGLLRD